MGKVQKKVKKTNKSAFSATHTYIKLTLVSFFLLFFCAPFPKQSVEVSRELVDISRESVEVDRESLGKGAKKKI